MTKNRAGFPTDSRREMFCISVSMLHFRWLDTVFKKKNIALLPSIFVNTQKAIFQNYARYLFWHYTFFSISYKNDIYGRKLHVNSNTAHLTK